MSGLNSKQVDISEQNNKVSLKWTGLKKNQTKNEIYWVYLCSVEKLLSMCSSSCLPGGGSNSELALHCLHSCQGDTMVGSLSSFSLSFSFFFLSFLAMLHPSFFVLSIFRHSLLCRQHWRCCCSHSRHQQETTITLVTFDLSLTHLLTWLFGLTVSSYPENSRFSEKNTIYMD